MAFSYLCVSVSKVPPFIRTQVMSDYHIRLGVHPAPTWPNYLCKSLFQSNITFYITEGWDCNKWICWGKFVQRKVGTEWWATDLPCEVTLHGLPEIAQARHAIFLREIASSKAFCKMPNARFSENAVSCYFKALQRHNLCLFCPVARRKAIELCPFWWGKNLAD